jgi:hypothetical protein
MNMLSSQLAVAEKRSCTECKQLYINIRLSIYNFLESSKDDTLGGNTFEPYNFPLDLAFATQPTRYTDLQSCCVMQQISACKNIDSYIVKNS